MFRKLALGLVAAAALSAAALAPTAASAKPFGPAGLGWRLGLPSSPLLASASASVGAVAAAESCYVTRLVETPFGLRYRTVNVCATDRACVRRGNPGCLAAGIFHLTSIFRFFAPQRRCARKHDLTCAGPRKRIVFPIPVATGVEKKLRRKPDDRSTRADEARRYGRACDGFWFGQGVRAGDRDLAVRERRAAAGEISAEADHDRPDQPPAAARDAVLGVQRRPDHAEQRVLRALSPRRRSDQYRSRQVHARGQGQGRQAAEAVAEGHPQDEGDRDRRRQSMLRQQPRLLHSARRRRPARPTARWAMRAGAACR